MKHSLLGSSFFIAMLLIMNAINSEAQEVIQQLGGQETDIWDAVSPDYDTTNTLFALGYQRNTQIADESFTAPDRGVVLGRLSDAEPFVWGQLYSRGNTVVHDICPSPYGIYVFGNAFSYLIYRGDTLFSTNGRNTAFIMQLDSLGAVQAFISMNSEGAVLGQAAVWQDQSTQLLSLFQIRDTFQWINNFWAPQATTASLVLEWSPDLHLQTATLLDGSGEIEATHLRAIDDEWYAAGRFKGQINRLTDTLVTPTADFDGFIYAAQTGGQERFIRHLRGQFEDDIFSLEVSQQAIYFGGQFIGNLRLQDLEILTGLQVAAFVGAMNRSGQALWMHPIRGTSISTAVPALYPETDRLRVSIWTGETTIFQGDSLHQPTTVGQVHSICLHLDEQGHFQRWQLWPGDPIVYITDFLASRDGVRVAAEVMGQFANVNSRGVFDAFLIDPSSTSSFSYRQPSAPSLRLFPQPAQDQLCIQERDERFTSYELYSLTGRPVQAGTLRSNCLSVSHLPAGTYVLRLICSGQTPPIQKIWIKS
jgi:hypothetical protein